MEPSRLFSERGLILAPAMGLIALLVLGVLLAAWGPGWGMTSGGHMRAMHGGVDTSTNAAVQGGAEATVEMRGSSFQPGNLTVPVGAQVTWVNRDSVPHDAAALDGSWVTPILDKGETAALTLDTAGLYDYGCRIHPSMKAKLTVVAAEGG